MDRLLRVMLESLGLGFLPTKEGLVPEKLPSTPNHQHHQQDVLSHKNSKTVSDFLLVRFGSSNRWSVPAVRK